MIPVSTPQAVLGVQGHSLQLLVQSPDQAQLVWETFLHGPSQHCAGAFARGTCGDLAGPKVANPSTACGKGWSQRELGAEGRAQSERGTK